jgi:hypothetical protein
MPKKVPNIQRIIYNDILKIVNIVFSGEGAVAPFATLAPPAVYGPACHSYNAQFARFTP